MKKTTDGISIQPVLLSHPIAAPKLLTDLVCYCVDYSCDADCMCLNNNQPCTADCSCKAVLLGDATEESAHCSNPMTYEHLDNESESDDGSDSN